LTDADIDGRALLDPATSVLSVAVCGHFSAALIVWNQAVSTKLVSE
jgi:hypothetical protein